MRNSQSPMRRNETTSRLLTRLFSFPRDVTQHSAKTHIRRWLLCCAQLLSHVQLFVTPWTVACQAPLSIGLYSPWNSPGQNTGVGSLSLLQGIFPTQGLNQGVSHCRQTLPAEPQRKPKRTEVGSLSLPHWIFPIQESNQGFLNCGGLFTNWAIREAKNTGKGGCFLLHRIFPI